MLKMTFITPSGDRVEVEAPIGLSVLEIAHRNKVELEGACEGSLAFWNETWLCWNSGRSLRRCSDISLMKASPSIR